MAEGAESIITPPPAAAEPAAAAPVEGIAPAPLVSDKVPALTDFSDLMDDGDEAPPPAPEPAAAPPPAAQAPATPPQPPKVAGAVPPAAEAPKPAAAELPKPAAAAETAPAAPQAAAPAAPEPAKPDLATLRSTVESDLAKVFALTKEEADKFATEPEAVLPNILAKAGTRLYEMVYFSIINQLPAHLHAFNAQMRAASESDNAFFQQWPMLNKPEYRDSIAQAAAVYKQLNPQATREQAIKAVGATLLIQHNLQAEVPAPAQANPPPAAAAPIPPVASARGGGAPPQQATKGPFDDLLEME